MDLSNEQTASGSLDPLTDEIKRILLKGARSPEENKKRKAELDFAAEKNRIIGRERRLEYLKERAKKVIRGEIDYE
jgi:hypothetical protein